MNAEVKELVWYSLTVVMLAWWLCKQSVQVTTFLPVFWTFATLKWGKSTWTSVNLREKTNTYGMHWNCCRLTDLRTGLRCRGGKLLCWYAGGEIILPNIQVVKLDTYLRGMFCGGTYCVTGKDAYVCKEWAKPMGLSVRCIQRSGMQTLVLQG